MLIAGLKPVLYQNPYDPSYSPMKMFKKEKLHVKAVAVYGSDAKLDAERAKRASAREKRKANAKAKRQLQLDQV